VGLFPSRAVLHHPHRTREPAGAGTANHSHNVMAHIHTTRAGTSVTNALNLKLPTRCLSRRARSCTYGCSCFPPHWAADCSPDIAATRMAREMRIRKHGYAARGEIHAPQAPPQIFAPMARHTGTTSSPPAAPSAPRSKLVQPHVCGAPNVCPVASTSTNTPHPRTPPGRPSTSRLLLSGMRTAWHDYLEGDIVGDLNVIVSPLVEELHLVGVRVGAHSRVARHTH
jgi:hypothetical protein